MESLVAMGRCVGIDEDMDGRREKTNNTKIQHHTTINTDSSFYASYKELQIMKNVLLKYLCYLGCCEYVDRMDMLIWRIAEQAIRTAKLFFCGEGICAIKTN